jgi:carbamate kinase
MVIALGGNALMRRGEPMTAEGQRRNIRVAAQAIAPLTSSHRVVVAHGNGPQVGLLALQADMYKAVEPYPLDVLGAETQGMIGYMLEQELGNVLPPEASLATLLTMVEVDPDDPAFGAPTKFVGPVYVRDEADRLAAEKKWVFRQDGEHWRRVVPSPRPKRIFEIEAIRGLLQRESVVICAGGGGIPTMYAPQRDRDLVGVEAVIDKDFASELLAEAVEADLFVMATDVDGVYRDWGTQAQKRLGWVTPADLASHGFPAGSMGPKVDAAVRFASRTGRRAGIGSLEQIAGIVSGDAGTNVTAEIPVAHAGRATAEDR